MDKKSADHFEHLIAYYEKFYLYHQADLGHYFRTLYHIFKFVKTSDITDKRRYTTLAREMDPEFRTVT